MTRVTVADAAVLVLFLAAAWLWLVILGGAS